MRSQQSHEVDPTKDGHTGILDENVQLLALGLERLRSRSHTLQTGIVHLDPVNLGTLQLLVRLRLLLQRLDDLLGLDLVAGCKEHMGASLCQLTDRLKTQAIGASGHQNGLVDELADELLVLEDLVGCWAGIARTLRVSERFGVGVGEVLRGCHFVKRSDE